MKLPPGGGAGTSFVTGTGGPEGLAFDSHGDLWVAENTGNQIAEFNSSGTLITTYSDSHGPIGLAIDSSDDVFIANNANDTIEEISAAGVESTVATLTSAPEWLAFSPQTSVPEPSSLVLLGTASAALAVGSRWNRRRGLAQGGAANKSAGRPLRDSS